MSGKISSSSATSAAAYFFAHGYGHYSLGQIQEEKNGMDVQEIILLAAILSIGPFGKFGIANLLVRAKKVTQSTANSIAAMALAAMVALFVFCIKRSCYGLIYINISIILSSTTPRALMIGFRSKEDVDFRSSKFCWPKMLSAFGVTVVVFCEPFLCDHLAGVGGHFLFDMSLAIDAFVSLVVNEIDEKKNAAEKLKVK